jgi:hypothetical protein
MKAANALHLAKRHGDSIHHLQEAATIFWGRDDSDNAGLAYFKIGQIQSEEGDLKNAGRSLEQARRCLETHVLSPFVLYEEAKVMLRDDRHWDVQETTCTALEQCVGKANLRYLTAAFLILRGDASMSRDPDDEELLRSAVSDYNMAVVELRARNKEVGSVVEEHKQEYAVGIMQEEYGIDHIEQRLKKAKAAEKAAKKKKRNKSGSAGFFS